MKTMLVIAALILVPSVTLPAQATSESEPLVNSLEQLDQLLTDDSVAHQVQQQSGSVVVPVRRPPIEGAMIIRWADQEGVVHFVQPLAITVTDEEVADINAAIVRLNHAIPVPCLGRDPVTGMLYYRMTVPIAPQGGLSRRQVRSYFTHTLSRAAQFHPAMQAVRNGDIQPGEIVEFVNRNPEQQSTIPPGSYTAELDGTSWTLVFADDGAVQLLRADEPVVESKWAVQGPRIRFEDVSGTLKVDEPGIYEWQHRDGTLQFRHVKDDAEGRQMVLTTAPWTHEE